MEMDVFVHDQQTGETSRASISSDGTQANDSSYAPSISADGHFIAFHSYASNLVSDDLNMEADVFVYNQDTGETRRISVASDGTEGNSDSVNPSISADGRFIAFSSYASNLVDDDTNGVNDIFIHDQQTGETIRISKSSDGTQGNNTSDYPSISADGRFVAFESQASNLVPNDTNGVKDVFVHDQQTGETIRSSVASDGLQGDRESDSPSISADGRYVAFSSNADNFVPGGVITNNIFVHDKQTGETVDISMTSDGIQGNRSSDYPSMSANGQYVAFESLATNFVPGDTNDRRDIFVSEISWQDAIPTPTPQPTDEFAWVLLFYLDGDNNLSASYNKIINQIEMGAADENIKIIVLWDDLGENNSSYYEIKYDENLTSLAPYIQGEDVWPQGEVNMGDPSTLSNFVSWAMENYLAQNYALILDDHGSGLGGGMVDVTSQDDHLTLNEMKDALDNITTNNQKIDVLVMNACLMGLIEDGYQFKDSVTYYVSSEDLQNVFYQGYRSTLTSISESSSPLDTAKIFVDGYADEMRTNNYQHYTMSVADLSHSEELKVAIEELASELNFGISLNAIKLWNVRSNLVQKFPSQSNYRHGNDIYIDLYHFAELITQEFSDQMVIDSANNLMSALNNYVVYNQSSLLDAHGVSIFFPDVKSSYYTESNNIFASGTEWSVTNRSYSRSDEPLTWGNLLVDLFREIDPEGPDNPYPPEPMPKADYSRNYLPLIISTK